MSTSTIAGQIARVCFTGRDDFVILRVRQSDGQTVGIKGTFPGARAGMHITATGTTNLHPIFGMTLIAQTIAEELPNTPAAIATYLRSAKIPGLGPTTARKLAETFGERVFSVLDGSGAELATIPRLSTKVRTAILEGWRSKRLAYRVMLFLSKLDIAPRLAKRVIDHFGGSTLDEPALMDLIRQRPYDLIEIPGIGFRTADAAALSMGIRHDASVRIRAAIIFALTERAANGGTATTIADVVRDVEELVHVDPGLVHDGIDALLIERKPVVVAVELPEPSIALARLANAEAFIARSVTARRNGRGLYHRDDPKLRGVLCYQGTP